MAAANIAVILAVMTHRTNHYGQPIGAPLPDWTPRIAPPRTPMTGRYCAVEPLDPARHSNDLFASFLAAPDDRDWTYLWTERPADRVAFDHEIERAASAEDLITFAIVDHATGRALGLASYMRIDPANGSIEIGSINFSRALMRNRAGTEAMFLMMRRVFDELGYRRYEWKCDALNAPSRAAAARYGFRFEGIFRQAMVTKGRNRDTAWFSIIDGEFPAIRAAFEAWLAPDNFSPDDTQRARLAAFRDTVLT
ncbi:GNAT family N-acetyltransferase [Acidiphilium iwatense]|uniref:GNAT family N-acetyltransferase n=2 Tax=Acidiphilium iwatense TaxID=768198 RepID=A0ABS9DUI3_9PROT|nr:GNAT family N-acetyltransferase [Acidiphilium iwatense]